VIQLVPIAAATLPALVAAYVRDDRQGQTAIGTIASDSECEEKPNRKPMDVAN
jgi:hypothetical protein